MLKIVTAPNSVLSKKAENYNFSKGKVQEKFLKGMEEALLSADDPKGVGLAAPQVNKSVRIFMAKPNEKSKTEVFINPKILESSPSKKKKTKKDDYKKLEGCLSLPNIWGEVERDEKVLLEWIDEKGSRKTKKFSGFMATIIQHEIDHLNGVLFPKRVLEQNGKLYKSHKENGKDVFEELKI